MMSANRKSTPMTTPPTEHDQPPTPDRRPPPSPLDGAQSMNESRPSSDRVAADAASPEDQLAWLLAAEDDETFVNRIFGGFGARLDELVCRIVAVLEDGRLDAGRRQTLLERIAVSGGFLMELADAVETDLGRSAS